MERICYTYAVAEYEAGPPWTVDVVKIGKGPLELLLQELLTRLLFGVVLRQCVDPPSHGRPNVGSRPALCDAFGFTVGLVPVHAIRAGQCVYWQSGVPLA